MKLEQFAMERMQSTYENQVEFNLSESGVQPLRLAELVDDEAARDALMTEALRYTQSNGTVPLRSDIAALYAGVNADHIQVTNGGSEANYITTWPLVNTGSPARWQVDVDALARLVSARTKLIIICNPNNPTGARIDAADLDGIAAIASRHGTWVLSDEIYRGAELDGRETPSMWGRSDRVIVTSGLSKAYGLPGLRIGWVVGPPATVAALWSYHDYTTISPGALSDFLARRALAPSHRARILARTRKILNDNFPVIARWLDAHGGLFSYTPPDAGAIVYVRYHHPINSTDLVNRLREQKSVLIVPGDHFGMDGYLRIGFGDDVEYLRSGLNRLDQFIVDCGLRNADSLSIQSTINP